MHIRKCTIENFRGITKGEISFGERCLLVGENNVGKTTILEALNLALGPDRTNGPDAIDEHDFNCDNYIAAAEEAPPEIRIEVILDQLSPEIHSRYRGCLELWNEAESRCYTAAEQAELPENAAEHYVLRIGFRGWYDSDEDEFRYETFFCSSAEENERKLLSKADKRRIGFLYLRSLRTATRAASLQRGSLLDILLGLRNARPKVWEEVLKKLREIGNGLETDPAFKNVLTDVETRIQKYLPKRSAEPWKNTLFVSDLTRRELRSVMTYFMENTPGGGHFLPFNHLGSGATNVLVLALLATIAEEKENVIFAMEEPETALPPYTQRRVLNEIIKLSAQTIVTSHSPYVAERFLKHDIQVLAKSADGVVTAASIKDAQGVDPKRLRQDFRIRYAEGLVSNAVLIAEGPSDRSALSEVNRRLADVENTQFMDLDVLGVTIVDAEGKDGIPKVAKFFGGLKLRLFAMSDSVDPTLATAIQNSTEWYLNLPQKSLEKLLADESSHAHRMAFLKAMQNRSDYPRHVALPSNESDEAAWLACFEDVLKQRKGEEYAALFIADLPLSALPPTLVKAVVTVSTRVSDCLIPATDPIVSLLQPAASDLIQPAAAQPLDASTPA